MRTEPGLNKRELLKSILHNYGLIINEISFVPEGECAYSYELKEKRGGKFFLKIYEHSRILKKNSENRKFSWKIAKKLAELGFENLSKPIPTKEGRVYSTFRDMEIVLWDFIEGKQVIEKERKTKEFMVELGEVIGILHNFTDMIQFENAIQLDYKLDFRSDLLYSIKEATSCTTSKDRNYNKLQKLIKRYLDIILESLVYLEEIAEKLKKKEDLDLVYCHSDPIRHNLLHEKGGSLFLVDWDGAILAPFEQDIWFYLKDEYINEFMESYKKKRTVTKIDEEVVIFLFYERILADLTDWIYRILFEETSKDQIKSDFKGLEEDVWPVLDNIKEIEQELRKVVKKLNEGI